MNTRAYGSAVGLRLPYIAKNGAEIGKPWHPAHDAPTAMGLVSARRPYAVASVGQDRGVLSYREWRGFPGARIQAPSVPAWRLAWLSSPYRHDDAQRV